MSIKHMQTVFDAGELSGTEKTVLLAYCNFTDAHGYCWPGVERIADMTGLSVSGVKKVRKQLLESKLLSTVSRGKKGGGRKTNGSRINIKRLEKMKLPPRDYDDNVMAELGFEEDDEPEAPEAKVPDGHANGSSQVQQRYPGGTNEGTCGDPYPSVDPAVDPPVDPSSSPSAPEPEPAPAAKAAPKTTKKTPEQIIQERLEDATDDEAKAVADYVDQQGDAHGQRIRSLDWWITNRTDRDLQRDLAHVRRYAAKPSATVCGLHSVPMAGDCSSCMGDIHAGDTEAVRAHLADVGPDARPDLAAVLGAPQADGGARYEDDPGAYWQQTNKAFRGGARAPLPTQEDYEAMANMSQEQLRDTLFGPAPATPAAPPKRRARQPAYAAFQNPTSPDAYTEPW